MTNAQINTQQTQKIEADTIKHEIDSMRTQQNTINDDCRNQLKELKKLLEEKKKKKDPDKNKKE